jgi:Flp pilus assembly pilin Flp
MLTYFQAVRQLVSNEKGAEIVEWVLWVGGIAILAGTLYVTVSGALSGTVNNIVGNISPISSS